jgi:hypothetical protein
LTHINTPRLVVRMLILHPGISLLTPVTSYVGVFL